MKKTMILFLSLFLCLQTALPLFAESTEEVEEKEVQEVQEVEEEQEETVEIIIHQRDYSLEQHSSFNIGYELTKDLPVDFQVLKPEILSINEEGKMTGKKPGETEVVLEVEDGDHIVSASVFVTVYAPEEPGEVFFPNKEFYLIRDLSYQVPYELEGQVTVKDLVWHSSNPEVATVENGIVYGHRIGETVIEAHAPDNKASMRIEVTAPLRAIEFNLDRLEMTLNEEQKMPELVYIPYDTTSQKRARFSIEDPEIVAIEGDSLRAKKIGKTKILAKVNHLEAELEVEVKAPKTASGANILALELGRDEAQRLFLKHDDLALYDAKTFVLKWPEEAILKQQKEQMRFDLYLVLDPKLYRGNVLERLALPAGLLKNLKAEQSFHLHLYDSNEKHYLSYHFEHAFEQTIDLNFRFEEVSEVDKGRFKLSDGSYHFELKQEAGFPVGTKVSLPSSLFPDEHGLYFLYLKDDQELLDLEKTMDLSEDIIQIELEGNEYILSPTKLSSISDQAVIWTLSLSFLCFLIFIAYRYYSLKD